MNLHSHVTTGERRLIYRNFSAAAGHASVAAAHASGGSSRQTRSTGGGSSLTPDQQAVMNQVDAYYAAEASRIQKLHDLATANYKNALDKVITANANTLANDTNAENTSTSGNLGKAWAAFFGDHGQGEEVGAGGGYIRNIADAAVRARDTAIGQEKTTIDASDANAQSDYQYNVAHEDTTTARDISSNTYAGIQGRQKTMSELLGLTGDTNNLIQSQIPSNIAGDTSGAAARAAGLSTPAPITPGYRPLAITATTPAGIQLQQNANARGAARFPDATQ